MLIDEATAIERLRSGAVIALPTDTVYGLCVAADAPGATAALFAVKERPASVPLPVLVADPEDATAVGDFDETARGLFTDHWPGALTIVVARRGAAIEWDLGGDGGSATIGLRCPNDETLRRIARAVGPLAVTSANLHGQPPCFTAEEVETAFGGDVLVLDGGRRAAMPSTVVDCTTAPPQVLRQGVIRIL